MFPLSGLNSACFTLRSKPSFPTFIFIYLEQEWHMHSLILTSLSSTPHRNVYCSLSKYSGCVYLLQCVLGKKHGPHGPSWHFWVAILQTRHIVLYCFWRCIFILVSLCCTQLPTTYTPVMSNSILVLCHFQASGCLSKEAGNGPRVTVDSFDSPRQVLFLTTARPQLTYVRN